ncbi:MAG TPA: methyltransferase domain-containing protein [Polyangiaceae bacterium]|jgi:SAM-dependent methyltransferase|nr:methyltransferase domain-containing protein [Polyangiaceae bacterium]
MTREGYLLSSDGAEAKNRMEALSTLFDPGTFRILETTGIGPGWACWEVGAGGPTVARWLSERVAPTGRVLATDLDVVWAQEARADRVEVRVHDVSRDEIPTEAFDLVHARLVLVHVVEREKALAAMVRSVRPGGFLVVEDADPALAPEACIETFGAEQELANKIRNGFRFLMAERGVDLAYGRRLPRLLREAGLTDVSAEAHFPIGNTACRILEETTVRQVRDKLMAAGLASKDEIKQHLANVAAGRLDLVTAPMISVLGRKPLRPS